MTGGCTGPTLDWTLAWIGVLKLVFLTGLHMAEQSTFHSLGKCKRALPPPTSSPAQLSIYQNSPDTGEHSRQHASQHNLLGFFHIFYGLRLKSLWAGEAAAGSRAACLVKVSSRCLAAVSISEPWPAQPWWGCNWLVVVIRTVATLSAWLQQLAAAAAAGSSWGAQPGSLGDEHNCWCLLP